MKIGILRADDVAPSLAGHFGEYPQMFEDSLRRANAAVAEPQRALEFVSYHIFKGEFPRSIGEVDAYILTGSQNSAYDDQTWIHQTGDVIRQLHAEKKPLIGICFGHQLVAEALGGQVIKSPRGWGIGKRRCTLTAAAGHRGWQAEHFQLIYSHQDQVETAAPDSVVLAGSTHCPIAMTALGQHILTFQGHPEFSNEFAHAIYRMRRASYPPETYRSAIASMDEEDDSLLVNQWILQFLTG